MNTHEAPSPATYTSNNQLKISLNRIFSERTLHIPYSFTFWHITPVSSLKAIMLHHHKPAFNQIKFLFEFLKEKQ